MKYPKQDAHLISAEGDQAVGDLAKELREMIDALDVGTGMALARGDDEAAAKLAEYRTEFAEGLAKIEGALLECSLAASNDEDERKVSNG
jgi:hypothetical protein